MQMIIILLDEIWVRNNFEFFIEFSSGIYGVSDKFPFTITGLTKS